jgi:hypothetical protein
MGVENKTPLEMLSDVTHLSKSQVQKIFDDVKENFRKLEECTHHIFDRVGEGMDTKYQCTQCGGTITPAEYKWFIIGLAHGLNPGRASDLKGD